jgi:hypothetical protein
MVTSVVVTQFIRRRPDLFLLREIPAYSAVPMMVGQAIEANRPVHVSWGSAGLGGANTLVTLASAELFYQIAERASIGAASPILTLSDPTALALGQDTLRRAMRSRGMLNRYRGSSVRWYPSGSRSLAFAAALTATMGDDRVGMSAFVGSFGAELALAAGAAIRRDQPFIAASDQLEGQAVALVMADHWLIGEEIFTAGAYLEGTPSQVASLVAQDVLRFLLILVILIPTALAVIDTIVNR